ncbi:MAG: peptidoglycan-associated lipoprotein Pal [Pseudomonadota bacterium]
MTPTFRFPTRALLVVAAMALSACAQGGFGGGGGGANDLNGANSALGSVNDPTSPAFFNQTIGDRVLFAVDQSTLSPAAESVLRQQAQWLLTNTEYTALIEGHADEQGTREYNLALGARRAASVQAFLVNEGVPATRLETISYGKERPIEICSDESCYQQNRRGVTVISANLGS